MSWVHFMNARKCVHVQKPFSSQAFAHESNKVGGRGKREDRGHMRLTERKATQQNKAHSEELKQGVLRYSTG